MRLNASSSIAYSWYLVHVVITKLAVQCQVMNYFYTKKPAITASRNHETNICIVFVTAGGDEKVTVDIFRRSFCLFAKLVKFAGGSMHARATVDKRGQHFKWNFGSTPWFMVKGPHSD